MFPWVCWDVVKSPTSSFFGSCWRLPTGQFCGGSQHLSLSQSSIARRPWFSRAQGRHRMWGSVLWGTPHPRMLMSPLAMKHTGAVGAKMGTPTWSWRTREKVGYQLLYIYIILHSYELWCYIILYPHLIVRHSSSFSTGVVGGQTDKPVERHGSPVPWLWICSFQRRIPRRFHAFPMKRGFPIAMRLFWGQFSMDIWGASTPRNIFSGPFGFRDLSPSRLVQNLRPDGNDSAGWLFLAHGCTWDKHRGAPHRWIFSGKRLHNYGKIHHC